MVIVGTKINFLDNSGIKFAKCIKVLGSHRYKTGKIGDKIIIAVKKANFKSKIKKNEIQTALILHTKSSFFRKIGIIINFMNNIAIIVDKKKNVPTATRFYGPIVYEMRRKHFLKVLAISTTII